MLELGICAMDTRNSLRDSLDSLQAVEYRVVNTEFVAICLQRIAITTYISQRTAHVHVLSLFCLCPPPMSTMKPSLPSFVDLLSSLGLNEAETQNRPSHLRNDSWGSQSSASSRISPMHSPQVRLSGRQPSNAGASRRFSPYGPPPDVSRTQTCC